MSTSGAASAGPAKNAGRVPSGSALATTAEIIAAEERWTLPTYAKLPIALVRGEGSRVWDADGRRYLDMYGGHCVALVGHGHPRLVEAVREQAGRLLFYSNVAYNDTRAQAAEALCALAPEGLRRVFFCNSGTEANETALKIARKDTGRKHVLSMAEGFHGRTAGALAATGLGKYREPVYSLSPEHSFVPYGELDALRAHLGRDLAAVILEPMPSMGGIRVARPEWFAELRRLCTAHGTLLIFDEVQTGFGRTGRMFFGEHFGLTPDLITGAKGVGGGFPAGVVFVREDVAARVKHGDQGTTFGGGPLACAAMLAVAEILREERLPEHAAEVGAHLQRRLSALSGVNSVTGLGLMLGLNLDRPAKPVVAALRERLVLCGGCESDPQQIRLLPPLTLSLAEADEFVEALRGALS
ncbi:MAG: aspartate aminotransferase family protein [Planctomycetota bacterium]